MKIVKIEFKLFFQAQDLKDTLTHLFWETNRLEESGKSIILVARAEQRYHRRAKNLVVALSKKRKAEENQP
jgi:hypothetical protein